MNNFKSLSNYGAVFGGIMIAVSLLIYLSGVEMGGTIANLATWGITLVALPLLMVRYRNNELGGYAGYGKVFMTGFVMMLFAAFLTSVYSYAFIKFIDPSIVDMAKQKAFDDAVARGASEEMAIKQIEMAAPFLTAGAMSFMAFLAYAFAGLLFSAIFSIFIRKENPDPFADTE